SPPMVEGNYVFQVETDPLNDGSISDIAVQPSLDLVRPSVDCDDFGGAVGAGLNSKVRGLNPLSVVVAPNPARGGQPLCVSLGSPVKSGHWTVLDLSGNPVDRAEFGPGAAECYDASKLASG